MPDRFVDYLLVGGGLAAAACARWLRAEGADGSVLLVGREPHPPYHRPPLSKGYLRGEEGEADALVHPEEWWRDHDVELLTRTSAMKLDPAERAVRLSTRETVGFGKLLLATGANVRRLRADGADLDAIHYLRAFGNSDAIREDAESAENVVMIGGSYIGTEVAASLTKLGKRCSIVMQEGVTLERQFGPVIGGFFQKVLEDHGVEVHGSDELERFEGADGRVTTVVTRRGLELPCDCAVVGVGVVPDVMLAKGAGLEIGGRSGVECSSKLETSIPGVFAAGDMAEYDSIVHGQHIRVEHWDSAARQGETVALNMLGRDVAHEDVPYFFSDLADWVSMESVGPGTGQDVVRGSLEDGDFTAFFIDEGRVTGAVTVGRSGDLDHARRFIRDRARPDLHALADPDIDLSTL